MIGSAAMIVVLTAVYLLALGSTYLWDAAIGAALAMVVTLVFRRWLLSEQTQVDSGETPGPLHRVISFFPWAFMVQIEVVKGTWQVLAVVLGLHRLHRPGIVKIPIGDRSEMGVAVSGLATTLSPGTVVVDIDWGERVMLVHAIDASDPEQVREDHARIYERYQRYVFP